MNEIISFPETAQRKNEILSGELSRHTQDSASLGGKESGEGSKDWVAPVSNEKVIVLPATSMRTLDSSPVMVTT